MIAGSLPEVWANGDLVIHAEWSATTEYLDDEGHAWKICYVLILSLWNFFYAQVSFALIYPARYVKMSTND